ncbi:FecR family protein [Sphingomonas silueang]|uniref:FecR family protein n=1 Tax=Sphingomonas silueang TaxID=3156617 RepID=UPI0032B49EFF
MHDPVEEAALRWALRHPLDRAGQIALDGWLAEDPRRHGALLRAMAALSVVERAVEPDGYETPARIPRRRFLAGSAGAMAAGIAGMVGWHATTGETVTTARGEVRRLPLADGSIAAIDTDSALRVDFGETRLVSLDRGQAWFKVAKDARRPFVVDAGIAQARAIGTAFSVDRGGDGVRIAVTEGTVAVWPQSGGGTLTLLNAGDYAYFPRGAMVPQTGTAPARIERTLAWRNGEIALENDTLAFAVAQFNRYNRQQLVIVDRELDRERLIGLFQIDRPGDFAATLAASFNVTVTTTPDEIRLSQKK